MFKSHELASNKKLLQIVLVSVVLGLGIFIYDYVSLRMSFDNSLIRNKAGSGNKSEELELSFLDKKIIYSVDIAEQTIPEEEIDDAFNSAVDEINRTYLGENESAEKVSYDLDLKDSYVNGTVDASWQFDNYAIISPDGHIRRENLGEEKQVVSARVDLCIGEKKQVYGFSFVVVPFDMTSIEGQLTAVDEAIERANKYGSQDEKLILPASAKGMELTWKRKIDFRGIEIMALGLVVAALIPLGQKNDEKKRLKDLSKERIRDYPMIVSELSILMGAGVSFRGALERICKRYLNKRENGESLAGYEEILICYRQMCDGVSERAAIENLGARVSEKEYRKLSLLLTQNLRKGSRELIDSLEKEEALAFEMRKQRAMKLGEEASTKLLLPMGGMLFVVIVILVVPAVLQMNI